MLWLASAFLAICQPFQVGFDGMESKVGLWFTQIIRFCCLPNLINQTKSIKPNFFIWAKPNLLKQRDQTKLTKQNLENQIYEAKCLKCNEPNIPNQFNSIKPTKLN